MGNVGKILMTFGMVLICLSGFSQEAFKRCYADGRVMETGSFCDGKRDGTWTTYDSTGIVTAVGYYDVGVKVGTWVMRQPGKVVEVSYANGRKVEYSEIVDGAVVFARSYGE